MPRLRFHKVENIRDQGFGSLAGFLLCPKRNVAESCRRRHELTPTLLFAKPLGKTNSSAFEAGQSLSRRCSRRRSSVKKVPALIIDVFTGRREAGTHFELRLQSGPGILLPERHQGVTAELRSRMGQKRQACP